MSGRYSPFLCRYSDLLAGTTPIGCDGSRRDGDTERRVATQQLLGVNGIPVHLAVRTHWRIEM